MGSVTRRNKMGASADCNSCDWRTDADNAMSLAGAHTRRTGHVTFVTVDYGVRLRKVATDA